MLSGHTPSVSTWCCHRSHTAPALYGLGTLVAWMRPGHGGTVTMHDLITPPASAELARIALVSPHFDAAVQGPGSLPPGHPGTIVVTVFGPAASCRPPPGRATRRPDARA